MEEETKMISLVELRSAYDELVRAMDMPDGLIPDEPRCPAVIRSAVEWEAYQIVKKQWEELEKASRDIRWAKSSAINIAKEKVCKAIPVKGVWFVMLDGMAVKKNDNTFQYPASLVIVHESQIAEDGSIIEPNPEKQLKEGEKEVEDDMPF